MGAIFNLDSPFMQALSKIADLMLLNVLTLVCCIPVVTAGASLTAMHYVVLKMVRGEECYLVRNFFKSFKKNFRQATIIWLLLLLTLFVIYVDYLIIRNSGMAIPAFVQVVIGVVAIMVVFASMFLFPLLAKFENPVRRTIINAFMASIKELPRTILMIILYLVPVAIAMFLVELFPIAFLFGLAAPAYGSAHLYNKLFLQLEDKYRADHPELLENTAVKEEEERIFHDEIVEDTEEA